MTSYQPPPFGPFGQEVPQPAPRRPMLRPEQEDHDALVALIRDALDTLRQTELGGEDVAVAKARLESWLGENEGRWVTS